MYSISTLVGKTRIKRFSLPGRFWRAFRLSEANSLLLLAVIIGIGGGFASVFFRYVLYAMDDFFFGVLYVWLSSFSPYLLPLVPMSGAILLIPFALRYPGEINGYGMPRFLISVHLKGGLIRTRAIFIKIFTAAITIGSGGSAGVEGPIAQIGGAVGSSVGRFFEMGSERLKVLIACGSAAGIAAQFNAPLAGVLFAQEIVMVREFRLQSFGAIVIASGLATAVSRAYYSDAPIFGKLHYEISGYGELGFYIILGVLIGVLAVIFIRFFFWTGDLFEKIKMHPLLKPILGAFLVGLIGLVQIRTLGGGYEAIIAALQSPPSIGIGVIASLVILKSVATAITLGSGNVGGVFAPSLFIGAMVGAVFGWCVEMMFPGLNIQPGSYALVGMGAFLAAATHAPMTSIFLLFELTNNYQVIIPIMFASVIGVMVARKLCPDSLDSMELTRQGVFLHSGREESILNSITTESVMVRECETIQENMTFSEFMEFLSNSKSTYFPVLNKEKKMTGIVSFHDIREIMLEEGLEDLVVMKELAQTDLIKLFPHDNLSTAIQKFGIKDNEAIPVVDPLDQQRLVGMLNRKDVMNEYNRAILIKGVNQQQ